MTTPPEAADAFAAWIEQDHAHPRLQHPAGDLLAEHHVMQVVLAAMEAEGVGLLRGNELRPAFWSDVVDFNGNFVHLCHRVKEEAHLIPVLVECQLIDAEREQAVHAEHERGKDLTLRLIDGVGEADWEKVMRLVSVYLHVLRPHMRREESGIFAAALALPDDAAAELRRRFDEVDERACGDGGRRRLVAIARRLADATHVAHDLPGVPS